MNCTCIERSLVRFGCLFVCSPIFILHLLAPPYTQNFFNFSGHSRLSAVCASVCRLVCYVCVDFFRQCVPIICGNVTFLFSLTYLIFELDIISSAESFCVQLKCLCFLLAFFFSAYSKNEKSEMKERERGGMGRERRRQRY